MAGFLLSKLASSSLEDYFLGGRKLPWWALGMAGTSSWFDVTGTMVIISFLYLLGPKGMYIEFRGGVCLVLAFQMAFTGKWHRRSNCITVAEWMAYRFGEKPMGKAARLIGAIGIILMVICMLGYMVKGVGGFLAMYLPYSPMTCAIILLGIATIYTLFSGFYGVVVTDIIQTLVLFVGVGVIVYMAIDRVGNVTELTGFDNLRQFAGHVTGREDWSGSAIVQHVDLQKGYERYNDLFMFAVSYFITNVLLGLQTGGDPRYFGARNERECGLLSWLWGWLIAVRWPMMIGVAVMGLFLVNEFFPNRDVLDEAATVIKEYHPDIKKERWDDLLSDIKGGNEEKDVALRARLQSLLGEEEFRTKLSLVSFEGTIHPEKILPAVLQHRIPAGIRGLLIIALISAAMSTFDVNINWAAGFFTRDMYQRFMRPKASNRELITISWGFTIFLVACGFGMASLAGNINDIWKWIIMGFMSGMAIPMVLRFYWWRFNAGGFVVASIVGYIISFIMWFKYGDLDERITFWIVTSVTFTAAVIATYLSEPTERKTLEYFYKTTRPFGLWGPLKKMLDPETRREMVREHRNDILSVPFIMIWQVSLFFMAMQLVIREWMSMFYTSFFFAFGFIGLYIFWWRNLPKASEVVMPPKEDEHRGPVTEPVNDPGRGT